MGEVTKTAISCSGMDADASGGSGFLICCFYFNIDINIASFNLWVVINADVKVVCYEGIPQFNGLSAYATMVKKVYLVFM